ncbi:MAG: hypothetical protein SGI98_07145, partial [Verrucomicrobiota bacterium]|nr:hypothetical protein [Verrucomicrobiota bacterium]
MVSTFFPDENAKLSKLIQLHYPQKMPRMAASLPPDKAAGSTGKKDIKNSFFTITSPYHDINHMEIRSIQTPGSAPGSGAGEGVPPESIPVTTFYHSNAFGLCGEYDSTGDLCIVRGKEEVSAQFTCGNLLKSYGYAPGSGWSTDPLFMKVVSPPAGSGQSAVFSYLYFHNDALGTPH